MKILQVGLGNFGKNWYHMLKSKYPDFKVVIVDSDPGKREQLLSPDDHFYLSFEEAVHEENPDFVLNLTPPDVHTLINHKAFDFRLPVLCEKPIANNYQDARSVVERASKLGIPLMIAENYRRFKEMRKMRQLIQIRTVGELTAIHIDFYRDAYYPKPYLLQMINPLLVDVAIHHLDSIRFLSGSEGKKIFAKSFNPMGSKYPSGASLIMWIEMENGIQVSYQGTLQSTGDETPWYGHWRVEGTKGVITLTQEITILNGSTSTRIEDFEGIDQTTVFDEFIRALRENRAPESNGEDYLLSQKLVHFAELSSARSQVIDIE